MWIPNCVKKNSHNLWIFSSVLSVIVNGVGTMGPRYNAKSYSCWWLGPCKWNTLPFSLLARHDVLNPTCGDMWVTWWLWKARKTFLFSHQALSKGDAVVTLLCLCGTGYLLGFCSHEKVQDLSRLAGGLCCSLGLQHRMKTMQKNQTSQSRSLVPNLQGWIIFLLIH